jgi:hypothetical protein
VAGLKNIQTARNLTRNLSECILLHFLLSIFLIKLNLLNVNSKKIILLKMNTSNKKKTHMILSPRIEILKMDQGIGTSDDS